MLKIIISDIILMKKKVLILCTGNSCRSIMAEPLVNHYLGNKWQAYSAGATPCPVNQRTKIVLVEIGIDISKIYSKSVEEFVNRDGLDLVITVCENAEKKCPVFQRPVEYIHIGFDDPAIFADQPDETALPYFRQIRDEIKERLLNE